jgi:hypothetical protein
MKPKNMTTSQLRNSIHPSLLRCGLLLVSLLLTFALPQRTQAVVPAPDGGYPGFNTAEGQNALFGLTTGVGNTAVGWFSLWSNTDGSFNTGVGAGTLLFNVGDQSTGEGVNNTALGGAALLFNTTGSENTALGTQALFSNTEGGSNTAVGRQALISNTTGTNNTANGFQALYFNTAGNNNTATGYAALAFNTSNGNTANGYEALFHNTTGSFNEANGFNALHQNDTGGENTANGAAALFGNTVGSSNTAIGYFAGVNQTTGANNVYIGSNMFGFPGESNACYIKSIFGQTTATGIPVLINSDNKLGTTTSSKRFKEEIKAMNKSSEALFALNPVTFRYKKEIDSAGTSQFGLVAEDVEKVNPDLVVRDQEGRPYSVRYDQVNAMLLNEFLKEHRAFAKEQRQVEEQGRQAQNQEATIADLKQHFQSKLAVQEKDFRATVAQLTARLEEQDSKIKQVSAQLEASKPAPQVVNNP